MGYLVGDEQPSPSLYLMLSVGTMGERLKSKFVDALERVLSPRMRIFKLI